MNIIIVDDDKLVSLSLKTILEASGEVNVCAIGNCGGSFSLSEIQTGYSFNGYPNGWNERTDCRKTDS